MRELVALFTQEDSRDELGIGAVRDAFSDLLFPGASVLQTRTRYLMFVPWIFREAEQRRMSGPALRGWAEVRERWLIPALRRGGDQTGLIGRIAGPGVKILPSTIYWTALQTYGIARYRGSLEQALRVMRTQTDEADELAERHSSLWHPTLPPPPKGFFEFSSMTFQLSSPEASWLAERIADSVGESMLGSSCSVGCARIPVLRRGTTSSCQSFPATCGKPLNMPAFSRSRCMARPWSITCSSPGAPAS